MKQSLPWSKKSSLGGKQANKGAGKYSDAVSVALKQDQSGEGVEIVSSPLLKTEREGERRLRTRSPSPVRYLNNHNKNKISNKGSDSYTNITSKYSKDETESNQSLGRTQMLNAKNEEEESNAASSTAPSFFNNRNIRSMSPAKLKMSLKQRIMEKVPSSPRRDHNSSLKRQTVEGDTSDGLVSKFAGASMSFDAEDDYEVSQINVTSNKNIPEGSPVTPDSDEFIINTTSYNIFENERFLHAMGGPNDASLTINYIRTGDTIYSSEEGQGNRALPLYYAGLGTILSRIQKWGTRANSGNENETGECENLVYLDFSAAAISKEMNILLFAMASILLRAGNANFSLGRFETACRDYASAQSYRALGGGENASVLVCKSREDINLQLEDAKLHGRISNNSACAQTKRKMYEEARTEYTKALQIKQKTLEKMHELSSTLNDVSNSTPQSMEMEDVDLISNIASTFHNIGLLRVNCDEPKKAEKAFKQSLSLRVKKFGLDDLGVSSTLCALGDVYFHQKLYDDAFRSYKESLRIWKFHRGNDNRTAELYYNIALVFYSKGPYSKAKLSVVECLRIRRGLCGNEVSLPVASSLQLLGLISIDMSDYEEALAALQEALAIRQKLLEKTSSNHLLIHNVHLAIGRVHSLMGEFDKSMKYFSIALMGRTIRLGKHHPLVAEVLHTIGDAYAVVNEYSKASETLEEALRIRKSLLGPNIEVAETLNSLSLVYFYCDETERAIELTEQSLKILKCAAKCDHILAARVLKNTGDYKQSLGSLDDAVEDYTESLRVMTAWQGRDHISLSEVLNEIGVTYFKKDDFVLAKESFTEVIIIVHRYCGSIDIVALQPLKTPAFSQSMRIMRLSGADKSIIFPTLSHLGHALYKNKEIDHAAEIYVESFKMQASLVTGEDYDGLVEFSNKFKAFKTFVKSAIEEDDDTSALSEALGGIASILRYLGLVYHAQGDPEYALIINKLSLSVRLCQPFREDSAIAVMAETIAMFEFKRNNLISALGYFNQALGAKKSVQGESTIDVARTVNNLANIHFSLGNLNDAMDLYQEALEIKKHCLGEVSDDVANTLNNIAHVMVTADKDQDALEAYHNVLKIRQDKYGKNHSSVADTLASMGDVYIKLGKLEIAMTYLEQVIRIRNLQGEGHDERVMENLASIYGKLGEWQKAEAAFKEILTLKRAAYGNNCLDLAKTLDLLAVSYIEQDCCAESIDHLQEALRIRQVCLGEQDGEVLASLNKLAFVYKSCNMTEEMLQVKGEFERIQASRKI